MSGERDRRRRSRRWFAPPASPRKTFGCPLVIEVVEEYVGLGLRHGDPAIRGDGEPCEDDLQLRVTWKVVTVVTGRAEEIGVEPAIVKRIDGGLFD